MNWCKPHWDKLREAIKERGMDHLGAQDGVAAARNIATELEGGEPPFDPLMGCWGRLNASMFESLQRQGRASLELALQCPMCILVMDGQPHLVDNWINGCADDALAHATKEGLLLRPA